MSFTSDLHLINLARQLLLAGAALLMLDGSALAEAPINTEKAPRTLIVSDSVQLAGSKISGGWREYAADGSWRRVAFVLDGNVASVTFGDGKNGSRVPGVTRYAYAGPGGKDVKDGDAKAVYSEAQVFAGASPEIRDKANQSAIVPSEVATRIRELGGDIKSLQQLADIRRISELGSAFDAARGAAADSGFFPDRPGGSPRRNGGGWKDPRGGVGHDGRAGDDIVESTDEHTDREGSHTTTIVTRHDDGSTTTVESWVGVRGSTTYSSTDKDVKGNVTGGSTEVHQTNGESTKMQYQRNPDTGEMNYHRITTSPDGTSRHYIGTTRRTAPSETPYSGRGGIDEAWMDKSLPWFMDTVYLNWKRENDLVQSGGRIAQPGRGDDSSPVGSEGPSAGASAVTNCGDSGTNPCARFGGSEVDVHGRLGGLSQPPLGDPRGGPNGMGVPAPLPIPPPKQGGATTDNGTFGTH